jgi:hypothetical protein
MSPAGAYCAVKWKRGDAEANRRAQELQKYELAKAGATTVDAWATSL